MAAPGPFRRLPGSAVRHLRGPGPVWPVQVLLELGDDELRALDAQDAGAVVGAWPRAEARARRVATGPPVQFVLELPGQSQLLAAAAGADTDALLTALVG